MDDSIANWSPERVSMMINARQEIQCRELEDYLVREIVDGYPDRQDAQWDRDYSSVEAFEASVAPNRERWRDALGTFEATTTDPDGRESPFLNTESFTATWITLRLFEDAPLRARAIVGVPTDVDGPVPLVICAHGAGSSPEKMFGYDDPRTLYKALGRELLEAGYAVMAPVDIQGDEERKEFEVLFETIGKTVWGYEAFKNEQLVEYLSGFAEIDTDRLGMWGLSMGGAATMFQLAYNTDIDVGICAGFFNERLSKHVKTENRYGNFRPAHESAHFYFPGWFREFADRDLVSLICPRPFMVQEGALDGIHWEPYLLAEWERAAAHYDRLDLADRAEFVYHDGGHEVRVDEGIAFLDAHL